LFYLFYGQMTEAGQFISVLISQDKKCGVNTHGHMTRVGQNHTYIRCIYSVGQNRIYAPYMTVYLVISLPKIPYIHRINRVLANPINIRYFWQGNHQVYGHVRCIYTVMYSAYIHGHVQCIYTVHTEIYLIIYGAYIHGHVRCIYTVMYSAYIRCIRKNI
jgi:hypothetical protein